MVNTSTVAGFVRLAQARAAHIPLVRDLGSFDLVVNSLTRVLLSMNHDIVEERRNGVLRDRIDGEPVDLVLRGAAVEAYVAVAAGKGARGGDAEELDVEGKVDVAVGVVFIEVWWVAEVAGSWRGQDEVGGIRNG